MANAEVTPMLVPNHRMKTALIWIVPGFGALFLGLADGLLIALIGVDFGRLGSFWFRLGCETAGLGAIFIGMALCLERWREPFLFVCGIATVWLVLTPGYYVIVDGPLAYTTVRPIDVLKNPTETLGAVSR